MLEARTVSTGNLPAKRRVEFWNEVVGKTLIAQVADPVEPKGFSGHLRCLDLGNLRCAEIRAAPSRITRSSSHVAKATERVWLLRLQLSGSLIANYEGQDICLHPGDFMLYDTSRPYRMLFHEPTSILALRIRQQALLRYIACPDAIACRGMSGSTGAGAIASHYLRGFMERCLEVRSGDVVARLADVALQLVASAYADVPAARADQSSLVTAHLVRIHRYIEGNLSDARLTPSAIAAALRITPAYLHRVFSVEHESVARYIMRRRLEECARALRDPMQNTRSITEIAFDYGFNSLAHFCRAFRAHYKMTPREVRHGQRDANYLPAPDREPEHLG
jgi:AraC-like DNA-binding protein